MYKYIKSNKVPIFAGTKYDKQAAKIISDSGLYSEDVANAIIQALFKEDIHAFIHSPNWLEKYLKGIARMLVTEANGSQSSAQRWLEECPQIFDEFLTIVKDNRDKWGGTSFDTKFIDDMSYSDVKNIIKDYKTKEKAQSDKELSEMKFGNSSFELIPIKNFQDFNSKFGGRATGDGSSDKYAGGGGTAWCHANSSSVYDSWTRDGQKFFVLADKNWQKIPFNRESNAQNPKDAYGNSLIAIRVDEEGNLLNATLRCNHVGVSSSADNQYKTFAELSRVAGFNVEEEILKNLPKIEVVEMEEIPDVSEISIGDKLEIPVGSNVFKATAVKEEDGGMLFVFDNIVGKSSMTNMQSFLDKFYRKLPENLRSRMGGNNLRLLDASEVFYKNEPIEWMWLKVNTHIQVENPPIPYFARKDFRACGATWWLRSVASPSGFVVVYFDGYANDGNASISLGVRPAFTIH